MSLVDHDEIFFTSNIDKYYESLLRDFNSNIIIYDPILLISNENCHIDELLLYSMRFYIWKSREFFHNLNPSSSEKILEQQELSILIRLSEMVIEEPKLICSAMHQLFLERPSLISLFIDYLITDEDKNRNGNSNYHGKEILLLEETKEDETRIKKEYENNKKMLNLNLYGIFFENIPAIHITMDILLMRKSLIMSSGTNIRIICIISCLAQKYPLTKTLDLCQMAISIIHQNQSTIARDEIPILVKCMAGIIVAFPELIEQIGSICFKWSEEYKENDMIKDSLDYFTKIIEDVMLRIDKIIYRKMQKIKVF